MKERAESPPRRKSPVRRRSRSPIQRRRSRDRDRHDKDRHGKDRHDRDRHKRSRSRDRDRKRARSRSPRRSDRSRYAAGQYFVNILHLHIYNCSYAVITIYFKCAPLIFFSQYNSLSDVINFLPLPSEPQPCFWRFTLHRCCSNLYCFTPSYILSLHCSNPYCLVSS